MSGRAHSRHEAEHCLGSGAAAVLLGVEQPLYENLIVHIHADKDGGEFALEFPEHTSGALQHSVAQLYAHGPIAALDDVIVKFQKKDREPMYREAGLSPTDLRLIRPYNGNPSVPLLTVLAVKHMEQMLGFLRFEKMCKAVRDLTNSNADPILLRDAVPYEAARAAVAKARTQLSEATDGISPLASIIRGDPNGRR